MKYKFVLAQITRCPSVIQWGWLIDDYDMLFKFIEQKSKRQAEAYMSAKKRMINKEHFVGMEYAYHQLFEAYDRNPNNPPRSGMPDDMRIIDEKFTSVPIKIFQKYGEILAWRNLFSFAPIGGYTYLEEVESDVLVFPDEVYTEDDIKITQWPGGKHWYAKLGDKDVAIDGKVKWNSYERAQEAANEYLESCKQQ